MANFSGSPNVLSGGFPLSSGGSTIVDGPGSSTDYALAAWNGTGGNLLRNTALVTDANGDLQMASTATLGFQIYNTSDQTTNYERLSILWSSNQALLRVDNGGTGTARSIAMQGGAGFATITVRAAGSSSGAFSFGTGATNVANSIYYRFFNTANTASSGTTVGLSLEPTYNNTSTAAATDFKIIRTETGLGSGVQSFLDFYAGATGTTQKFTLLNTGKFSVYGGVTTAGFGVPVIVASANITAQTAAATITSFATAAADSDFEIACQLNCSAATSLSAPFQCTYTDVNNVAKTLTFAVQDVDGTGGTFLANGLMVASAAKTFMTPVMRIRVKASTTITLKTGTGTYTGVTYSASGTIVQLN